MIPSTYAIKRDKRAKTSTLKMKSLKSVSNLRIQSQSITCVCPPGDAMQSRHIYILLVKQQQQQQQQQQQKSSK